MKKLVALILAAGLASTVHAAPPTPESIEKLLKLTQAEKIFDAIRPQLDNVMKSSMAQALKDKQPSPEEQAILDKYRARVIGIMQDELTLAKLKPIYIDAYTKNFDQKEINGLIAFYESPVGKSFTAKMPAVMQSVMGQMPKQMQPMMQQFQQASADMQKEFEALHQKQGEHAHQNPQK